VPVIAVTDERRILLQVRRSQCVFVALQPFPGIVNGRGPADDSNPLVAGLNHASNAFPGSSAIVHQDRIAIEARQLAIESNDGNLGVRHFLRALTRATARAGHQENTVDSPRPQGVQRLQFPIHLIVGVEDHERVTALPRSVLGSARQLRKKRIADVGNHQADHSAVFAFQAARDQVRMIIQFMDDLQYAFAALLTDGHAAVEDIRNGCNRYAGTLGDFFQGDHGLDSPA